MPISTIVATFCAAAALFIAIEWWESYQTAFGPKKVFDGFMFIVMLMVAGLGFGVAAAT